MNINHIATELFSQTPDLFSRDFKHNKEMISKQMVLSPFVRNQVAGCITRIKKREGHILLPKRERRVEEPRRPRR